MSMPVLSLNNLTAMDRNELVTKLKAIIKPYTNNQEAYDNLDEDTDFIRDLNINSANLVDIILDIEEAFHIVIDNTDMEKMLNVKASVAIIESKLQQE